MSCTQNKSPEIGLSPIAHALWRHNLETVIKQDWGRNQTHLAAIPDQYLDYSKSQYSRVHQMDGRMAANSFLKALTNYFKFGAVNIAGDDADLCAFAKRRADTCAHIFCQPSNLEKTYRAIARETESYGIPAQKVGRKCSLQGAISRMCDEHWWRRAVRSKYGRGIEGFAIGAGFVHKHKEIYASDETVSRRQQQKARNRNLLESLVATNELDQSYTLQELADLSVSNPRVRRGELMVRMAGFEEYAQSEGYVAEFYTTTCPSRMHARLARSGDENPKYDGTTPADAQSFLAKQFAKIRSALKREGFTVFGFRVAEPQHDGTPHWHLLLFMRPEDVDTVRNIFRHYALEVDGNEPGAKEHRFKAVAIDWGRGTATGYVAKYVSKNIDGYGLDTDLYGHNAKHSAIRIDAWASTWGIHQFEQIGGPPVGVWRELRRASGDLNGPMADAQAAADSGDWAAYIRAMGGIQSNRKEFPVNLAKEYSDKLNRYGEPIGLLVFGVQSGSEILITRVHLWTVQRRQSDAPSQPRITTGRIPPGRVAP